MRRRVISCALLANIGKVESVMIVKDRNGRSRGYGFVEMVTEMTAQEAVRRLNGSNFQGRRLTVAFANSRAGQARQRERAGPPRPRGSKQPKAKH
jgi:RNA recognition motif-containing protein